MIVTDHKDNLVTVTVYGELTLSDYKEFEALVNDKVKSGGTVNLLCDLRQMAAFTLDVAWEDIKFERAHSHDFGKIAVLTDSQWVTWSAWLSQAFVDADLRVFRDEQEARDWLSSALERFTTLIDAADLARHLQDADWRVFDCSFDLAHPHAGELAYREAHIPGAVYAHLERDLAAPAGGGRGRHPLPDPARLAAWLGEAGVGNGTQVVVYDDAGGTYAGRMWWLLRWLGHDAVALLDGGVGAWEAAGGALTDAPSRPPRAVFTPHVRTDMTVDVGFVQTRLAEGGIRLLDARNAQRFRGENETQDPVGGHIPGAINRFFKDNLLPDGRFKSAAALRTEYAALLDGRGAAQVVNSCGSGVTACHNLLAMEIAGLPGSRLYPGSWSEWCADPARPIATTGP
ncbi:MAG: STAS/SEC14 domain-containing protein [Zoogloeaceae bacterium]|jgi:thiosulfate/3-mercaptopyruvate sulfurtransferase|nr:STAS/SEC14 domain-containing protein [Zoogloeaceae bacterium]